MGYLLSNPHPLPAKKDVDRGINHCILVYYSDLAATAYLYVKVCLYEKQQFFSLQKNNNFFEKFQIYFTYTKKDVN